MTQKIKLDDTEYDIEEMTDKAKGTISRLQFVDKQLLELSNMQSLLRRAKKSYIETLKKEILAAKAGFTFDTE